MKTNNTTLKELIDQKDELIKKLDSAKSEEVAGIYSKINAISAKIYAQTQTIKANSRDELAVFSQPRNSFRKI